MTGSVSNRTLKFRVVLTETFKQYMYYPQILELTSVYNAGSLHVSAKWVEKKKLFRPEKF